MKKIYIITLILIPLILATFKELRITNVINTYKVTPTIQKVAPLLNKNKDNYNVYVKGSLIGYADAAESTDINPSSYVVLNFDTGEVVAEKNMDQAVPIASVTKIMTAVVALDLAQKDDQITISKNAAEVIPTKIGVIPGEKMMLSELIESMLLVSANDAAQAIKDGIDTKYKDSIFIKAMNQKAKYLGLQNTSFANPQGFDSSNNYSSARDLAILSHYALKNYPFIKEVVAKDYIFLPQNKYHKQFDLQNWNGLLDVYPGADGIKIGNTDDAGYTTIVTAQREGKKVLVVVLGAPGILQRDEWAASLLDQGFEQVGELPKINITEDQLRAKYATWKYWN